MKTIYFFKPLEANYVNKTTSIYSNIIKSLPNVVLIDLNNFDNVDYKPNSIVVYMPITLIGSNKTTFKNLMYRLKYIYNTPNLDKINYELLNKYYNTFLDCINISFNNICILYELDLHDLVDSRIQNEFLIKYNSLMLLGGPELYDTIRHNDQNITDIDMDKVRNGLNFLTTFKSKIISLPHVIAEEEILNETTSFYSIKKFLFSVPGTKYILRKKALSIMKRIYFVSFLRCTLDWYIMKILYKIPISSLKLSFLHTHFTNQISKSKFCFTCGSTAGYLIRKFFEIPSFGSIIITYNYKFLENCGFIPNTHYIPINNLNDFKFIVENRVNFIKDQSLKDIHFNSLALIRQKHSSLARYLQLLKTFEAINLGNFRGSYWEKGNYIINTNE